MLVSKKIPYLLIVIVLLVIVSLVSSIWLYFLGNRKTDFVKIPLTSLDTGGCPAKISEFQITFSDPSCLKKARFSLEISKIAQKLGAAKIWLRSYVKSTNERTGVHISNGEKEFFNYHSGDGKTQLLIGEAEILQDKPFTLSLVLNELKEAEGPVTFGPIFLSRANGELALIDDGKDISLNWARTNNPNHDFWFDRYTSQKKNFSITIPNDKNTIWEKYFSVGINDRFNSGDYFCFPDDNLLVIEENGNVHWLYLGALAWKRVIQTDGPNLTIIFTYDGPLVPHERMKQDHAIMTQKTYSVPEDFKLYGKNKVQLEKKYSFNTQSGYSEVTLKGKTNIHNKVAWVIEDAAYMDFQTNSTQGVRSFVQNKEQIGSFEIRKNDGPITPPFIQYRLRAPANYNLATGLTSFNYDFKFAVPFSLKSFLHTYPKVVSLLVNETPEVVNIGESPTWTFGIGFFFRDHHIDGKFRMYFTDSFRKPSDVSKIMTGL